MNFDQDPPANGSEQVVVAAPVTGASAKGRQPPPMEQPASKKQKVTSDSDMGFGFDNEAFSDHKLLISIEGSTAEPRTVHVSKLLVARASAWFRSNMTASPTTEVKLPQGSKIDCFVDIIKWMYFTKFDTTGMDLLDVMKLAFKFKIFTAVDACASELQTNINVENACKFLENEEKVRSEHADLNDTDFGGFVTLWNNAKTFLKQQFQNFNFDRWSQDDFKNLSVEGLKVVLSSDEMQVGTENTIFAAFREWMHHDFDKRKLHAVTIIPLIRFPLLQQNYMLDVVRTEADLDYPEDAKKQFAKRIIDAYVYHSISQDRHEALKEFVIPRRIYNPELLQTKFYWTITNISQKKEATSDAFFIGGYYLYLLFQRKNITSKGGGSIALYMHLKIKESGLGNSFYLPLAFELLSKNKNIKKYVSHKGVYSSPFTYQHRAWGYIDILGITWEDFINPSCVYNDNDSLHMKCCVAFKEPSLTQ